MTSPSSSPDLVVVQTVVLPGIDKGQPILLHTVVEDERGNLYYSDEINHCVTSLDQNGELRCQRGRQGHDDGEFHYPRGMSLGVIEKYGESSNCLAMADAWNHRIQFLDLDGNPIASWRKAGKEPFVEVSDVRFVSGVSSTGPDFSTRSCWLVLDKGAHRLFAVDPAGSLLFETGRCLAPALENRWALPGMFFQNDRELPRILKGYPPINSLFYPERILGKSPDAIFLTEPNGGTVKQVIYPNLFPIRLGPDHAMDWIAADSSGLWAWNPAEMCLVRFDADCNRVARIKVEGVPVPSTLPSDEL